MMEMEKEFLTTEEAARVLDVKKNTMEIWRVRGCGPTFHKFGRNVRYHIIDDLEAYKKAQRRTSTSDQGRAA